MKRIISVLVILILIITVFSGCGDDDFSVYYQIYSAPKNLDPLLAQNESETAITGNVFEGLMKLDSGGKAVMAGAESYSVSGEGTVYTFKLNKDKKWSDGSAVTAHDYVFALQRAADPETGSPYTGLISNIIGVQELLNGTGSRQSIGVRAQDDYTLTISLTAPCTGFLERLTQNAFMPCNKEFFEETKGKYGLSKDTILSNGYFEITSWDKEKGTVGIARSDHYSGDISGGPSYVSFAIYNKDETSNIQSKISQKISLTKIDTGNIESYIANGYNIYNSYSGLYALVFDPSSPIAADSGVLKALRADIDASAVSEKLPDYFKPANGVVPPDCDISLSVGDPAGVYSYSPGEARELFLSAQKSFENGFPQDISVLCAEDPRLTEILKSVVSVWQRDLGAYFNIETVEDEETFKSRLSSGDYDIALVPFDCSTLKAETFLSEFLSGADNNVTGFQNAGYDALVNSVVSAEGESKREFVHEAERMLISQNDNLIPLFFSPVSYACSSDINPDSMRLINGYIDLVGIMPA